MKAKTILAILLILTTTGCIEEIKNKLGLQKNPNNTNKTTTTTRQTTTTTTLISHNFTDLGPKWCRHDYPDNKRIQDIDKYINQKVQWKGTLKEITTTYGTTKIKIKHCPKTITHDITLTLTPREKQKLENTTLNTNITYTTKITAYTPNKGLTGIQTKIQK